MISKNASKIVIELPVKARINVLHIVPIISFPILIPDLNNCDLVICGLSALTSYSDEAMDMPTSMTAPKPEIKIPENKTSLIFSPVC